MPLDWIRLVVRLRPAVSIPALAIAAKITTLAKGKGSERGTCFASVRTLAEIGMSESSVRRATAELQARGLLIMLSRGGRSGDGHARATTWALSQPTTGERMTNVSIAQGGTDENRSQLPTEERMIGLSTAQGEPLNRSSVTPQESSYQESSSSSSSEPHLGARDDDAFEEFDKESVARAAVDTRLSAGLGAWDSARRPG
jgi:hypothetical protein